MGIVSTTGAAAGAIAVAEATAKAATKASASASIASVTKRNPLYLKGAKNGAIQRKFISPRRYIVPSSIMPPCS